MISDMREPSDITRFKDTIIVRFKLTGTLSAGGTASAHLVTRPRNLSSGGDDAGSFSESDVTITVDSGYCEITGASGQKGYAILMPDSNVYEVIQMTCS